MHCIYYCILYFYVIVIYEKSQVSAFSHYRDEIPNGHNVKHPCDSSDPWIGVGHSSQWGGGPRNSFGLAFAAAGKTWTLELCKADSDGDGKTNGEELGDPKCIWTKGSTPQRTTDITHPGICDSATSTSSSCATPFKC